MPVMDASHTQELIELVEKYGAHNYHPLDVVIDRAEGVWVYDIEGKRYAMRTGDVVHVPRGVRHKAIGKLTVLLVCVPRGVLGDVHEVE